MICINCNSENLKKLGMRFTAGRTKNLGYECNDCGTEFLVPYTSEEESLEDIPDDLHYIRNDEYINKITSAKKIVFTTAINNTKVNKKFYDSIKQYCEFNSAELVVFPLRYCNPSLLTILSDDKKTWYDESIEPYLVENNFEILPNLKALGGLKTQATVENPLSGVDGLSKGYSIIFGHPQVSLKTLPRNEEKYPAIATTTGAITEKNYSSTKVGYKAGFNHSMSALILEIDDEGDFFIRHLNFDGKGFYDLDYYYDSKSAKKSMTRVEAIITGDEHAVFIDPEVLAATYNNKDSIVSTLNPKYIVRHDVLDFFSGSHHHKKDTFLKFAKHHSGRKWSVKSELELTVNFINDTTPKNTKNLIIASNHNSHLLQWLNDEQTCKDMENAVIYHYLMYKVLEKTKFDVTSGQYISPDPFELYASDKLVNTEFLSRNQSFKIKDVDVSDHGDVGVNGSRGSSKQFSNIPVKNITGHSHSPVIDKGNYTVGTSSLLRLGYNKGYSSWDHCHCLIYPNGKRQLIFIRNGKYRSI